MIWKSVDFPEPEGPTIDRNSPRGTIRSTPRSAGTCTLPTTYVLRRSRVSMIAPLFIRQRLDGILARRAEPRIERAEDRADQRHHAGLEPPRFHDDHRDGSGDERADQVICPIAHDNADHRPADPQRDGLRDDDAQNETLRGAKGFEN